MQRPRLTQLSELSTLLVRCRADRRLTLEDVRAETGLSVSWLSELETGKKKIANRIHVLRLEKFLVERGYPTKKAS